MPCAVMPLPALPANTSSPALSWSGPNALPCDVVGCCPTGSPCRQHGVQPAPATVPYPLRASAAAIVALTRPCPAPACLPGSHVSLACICICVAGQLARPEILPSSWHTCGCTRAAAAAATTDTRAGAELGRQRQRSWLWSTSAPTPQLSAAAAPGPRPAGIGALQYRGLCLGGHRAGAISAELPCRRRCVLGQRPAQQQPSQGGRPHAGAGAHRRPVRACCPARAINLSLGLTRRHRCCQGCCAAADPRAVGVAGLWCGASSSSSSAAALWPWPRQGALASKQA